MHCTLECTMPIKRLRTRDHDQGPFLCLSMIIGIIAWDTQGQITYLHFLTNLLIIISAIFFSLGILLSTLDKKLGINRDKFLTFISLQICLLSLVQFFILFIYLPWNIIINTRQRIGVTWLVCFFGQKYENALP